MFQPIIIMRIRFAGLFLGLLLTCGSGVSQSTSSRLLPFQGRLVDASGKPIPDGVRVVQFQIYSEPLEGKLLWPGEVHRVTVNGGLVNVVLGSKNPLPRDKSDQTDKSFFDQPLFLQITVDANGDGKISDDKLDPPMLPRQSILPVIFATEAAHARQSDFALKLADGSWGDLFSNNDPRTGLLNGARIQPGTIGGDKIANDASITLAKLAPREVSSNVGEGGVAISKPSGEWISPTPGVATQVPNLIVSIRTTGRPVLIVLTSGGSSTAAIDLDATSGFSFLDGTRAFSANLLVLLFRDGKEIANEFFQTSGSLIAVSPGSVHFMDTPTLGTYVYSIKVGGQTPSSIHVRNVALVAFEL